MILLPTLNRIDGLTRFFKAFTEAEDLTPGLVLVDEKDFESKKSTYLELKDHYFPDKWDYRITKGITMGDKTREVWPEIENLDWVGILNDDHVLVTPHGCEKLIAQLTGKNFISCSDRWNSPARISGLTAWSMPLIKATNIPIFIPGMQHLYIDDLWKVIADNTGCWDLDHSVVIEHKHVLKRESPMDQTHQKTYAKQAFQLDHDIYQKYLREEMPKTIEKIREFMRPVIEQRQAHG